MMSTCSRVAASFSTAEAVFKPIRAFLSQRNVNASYVSKVGPAAEFIVESAQKGDHDLIILGSHGHGTLTSLVMGSVTAKVLSHCSTPVLLIR